MRRLCVLFVAVFTALVGSLALAGPASAERSETFDRSGGAAAAVPHAKGACDGDWIRATAGFSGWAESQSQCAVFGSTGYKVGYKWEIQDGTNARACVQGMGFIQPSGGGPKQKTWVTLGCGSGGQGLVVWGNAAAYPTVRAKTQPGMGIVALYVWRH